MNIESLINDRNYYISKLKKAIQILHKNGMSILEICQALDIEYKEYEYIVEGM